MGKSDETGAVEILVKGDAMGSNYKVRGTEICQVSRVMGRMAFVIDTQESLDTGNGYVSTLYDVVFRNPQTDEVTKVLKFNDTFQQIGDYYVMSNQVIQSYENGERITTEFNFSNVKLLEPVAV